MKRVSGIFAIMLAIVCFFMCFLFVGCAQEPKYTLTVENSQLLYEPLADSYKAGEEVAAKVKITPYESTVAYLDYTALARSKSSQDDFYVFTFTMPDKTAVLRIESTKYFGEDLLVGFHLTFTKDGNPIDSLNKELKSPNAVAHYLYTAFDKEIGSLVVMDNDRADVFVDGISSVKNNFGKIELEDNLYFTYELLDALALVSWVYLDEEANEVSSGGSDMFVLDELNTSGIVVQSLTNTRYNERGEEYEATFDSQVKINFKYIDYLTGVKVLEYDKNNQLIKSSNFTGKERFEFFTVGENCEYVIIEEEYTVMQDGENKGEKHYERTLIGKSGMNSITLKYARGDGLISPVFLSVQWADEAA